MEKINLISKGTKILEETKNQQEKYHKERVAIFKLIEHIDDKFNEEILECIVSMYNKNKELEHKAKCYDILKEDLINIEIRKIDKIGKDVITIFEIEDRNNKKYTFFNRNNAKAYIANNSEKFEKNTDIQIIENNNIDLNKIIKSIKDE